jgi:hypothetical protein
MLKSLKAIDARRAILLALTILLMLVLAACGGSPAAPKTSAAPTAAPQARPTPSSEAQAPQACALLTVADVEQITGYSGGAATPTDLGEGATQCTIVTGKGALSVQVNVGQGSFPILPGEKTVALEGGAQGIASAQTPFNQDWMTKINFPNYGVSMLVVGSAATIDPDQKIANVTQADGSAMTFGQVYETFARAIARNAASGAPAPSGVAQLGDPCAVLALDDVKQILPEFDITGPDYQGTTFGGQQCIYRFRSDALQANGFVTLALITQPQFDAFIKGEPQSGIGDAAWMGGGLLDLQKGDTFVHMAFTAVSTDPDAASRMQSLNSDGFKQLAQKAAARIQ